MNVHIVYSFNLIRDRKKEIVYLDLVSFKGGERSKQLTTATMIVRRRRFKRLCQNDARCKQKSRLSKPMCVLGMLLLIWLVVVRFHATFHIYF